MTQIFEIVSQSEEEIFSGAVKKNYKQSIKAKMKKFFLAKNITCQEENQSFFTFLEPSHFCNPQLTGTDIFGLLQITAEPNNIHFKLSLLDSHSIQIKAVSTYQKTGLSRLCNVLSSNSLIMACHPLTGRLKFTTNIQTTQPNQISQIIDRGLKIIQDHRDTIDQILQFLELVPFSMSNFMHKIAAKMEKCRYFLLGPHQRCKFSNEKDQHQEYFIQPLSQFSIVHYWMWQKQNKQFLYSVIQRLQSSLIFQQLSIKKNNCQILNLAKTELQITKSLETIVEKTCKNKLGSKPIVLDCMLTTKKIVPMEFTLKKEPSCKDELTKTLYFFKSSYCSFLKQYVVIDNLPYANTYFDICIYEKLTPLNKFLSKYRLCLSFGTRLSLCQQIIGIGYTNLLQIKKFSPQYTLENLQVTQDLKIKLKSIKLKSITPISIQIAEVCYTVLYDVRCSSHKVVKEKNQQVKIYKKTHTIKIIDDGQSKFEGISVINFWLKKILLDVIDNKNRKYKPEAPMKMKETSQMMREDDNCSSMNTEQYAQTDISQALPTINQQIQTLEQILFVVSTALRTYSEIFRDRWEDTIVL